MQRTSIDTKPEVTEDLKLAIRTFLEYLCWSGANYRVAMDLIEEYSSGAWDSAHYKTNGFGTATIEDIVHQSDATPPRHNSTPIVSWTHTQGGFNR